MIVESLNALARSLRVSPLCLRRLLALGYLRPAPILRPSMVNPIDLDASWLRLLGALSSKIGAPPSGSEGSLPPVSTHSASPPSGHSLRGRGWWGRATDPGQGPSGGIVEEETPKMRQVLDIIGKTGRRKRKAPQQAPDRERIQGEGPRGGRNWGTKKIRHPIVEDMIDGRI